MGFDNFYDENNPNKQEQPDSHNHIYLIHSSPLVCLTKIAKIIDKQNQNQWANVKPTKRQINSKSPITVQPKTLPYLLTNKATKEVQKTKLKEMQ